MTRFARGPGIQRKQEYEASSWKDLSKGIRKEAKASDQAKKAKAPAQIDSVKSEKKKKKLSVNAKKKHAMRKVMYLAAKRSAHAETRRETRVEQRQQEKVCFKCRETGHAVSDCKQGTKSTLDICFKCGSAEHNIHNCRAKVPKGTFPFAKCFICGEKGHLSRACPDNPRGLYPNGGCCGDCGSVEHFRRDCPQHQKERGVPALRLRTAGALDSVEDIDAAVEHDSEAEELEQQRPAKTKKNKVIVF